MKSNIFIPKTINVGYQERKDTYTGKLAYVIYYDEKGKLRKETSWNNWRDLNIPNEEFENVPTSGFVLNRRAGGVEESWGWNARKTYCRIYDPRNFEFEITIENLLYILENTNSIKGKGLEGEFVYGWDGKDLVLMPVEAPDYKQILEYNDIVHDNKSFRAKDLTIGATYLTKDNDELIFMGKFDYYDYGYRWISNGEYKYCKKSSDIPTVNNKGYGWQSSHVPYESIDYLYGKYFWFAYKYYDYKYVNGEKVYADTYSWSFIHFKSITANKLISCVDEKCTQDYADIYERMIRTKSFSPRDYDNPKYISYTFEEFKEYAEKIKDIKTDYYYRRKENFFSSGHYRYRIIFDNITNLWIVKQDEYSYGINEKNDDDFYNRFDFKEVEVNGYWRWDKKVEKRMIPITIETLYEKLKPCYKEIYLANGYLYERECYYGDEK